MIGTERGDVFTLKELFHFKWEFLMIHMAGFNQAPAFNTDYLLGPAWFISSLLLALIPFRFLLSSPFSLVRRQAGKRIFSVCVRQGQKALHHESSA